MVTLENKARYLEGEAYPIWLNSRNELARWGELLDFAQGSGYDGVQILQPVQDHVLTGRWEQGADMEGVGIISYGVTYDLHSQILCRRCKGLFHSEFTSYDFPLKFVTFPENDELYSISEKGELRISTLRGQDHPKTFSFKIAAVPKEASLMPSFKPV